VTVGLVRFSLKEHRTKSPGRGCAKIVIETKSKTEEHME